MRPVALITPVSKAEVRESIVETSMMKLPVFNVSKRVSSETPSSAAKLTICASVTKSPSTGTMNSAGKFKVAKYAAPAAVHAIFGPNTSCFRAACWLARVSKVVCRPVTHAVKSWPSNAMA